MAGAPDAGTGNPNGESRFWQDVLGPDWETRGPRVVLFIAQRKGMPIRHEEAKDYYQEAVRRAILWVRKEKEDRPRENRPPPSTDEVRRVLPGIVKNILRDVAKHARTHPGDEPGAADPSETLERVASSDHEPHSSPLDARFGNPRLDMRRSIRITISALSERQRSVFRLRYIKQMKQSEIARELSVSEPTISRDLRRIRELFFPSGSITQLYRDHPE